MKNFTKFLERNRSGWMKVLLVVVGMVWGVGAWGANYYIAPTSGAPFGWGNGSDAAGRGTAQLTPYATLAYLFANQDLGTGDIVYIAAGTYSEKGIVVGTNDEGFTLQGAALSSGVPTTIFDSDQTDGWLYFGDAANDNIAINNIYIKDYKIGSNGSNYGGSGLRIIDGCTGLSISNTFFDNCDAPASARGGAIHVIASTTATTMTLNSVSFFNCDAPAQGGAFLIEANSDYDINMTKCQFYSNTSTTNSGSAIYYTGALGSTLTMTNCLVYGNTMSSNNHGTIYISTNCVANLTNCTVANNTAKASYTGGVYYVSGGSTLKNCILYGNTYNDVYRSIGTITIDYCNYGSHTGCTVTNSITSNPLLASNYKLRPSSPCINAGTTSGAPSDDLASSTRTGNPDLGCYERICSGATSFSGSYDVGTTGQWTTLTNAIGDLQTCMTATVTLNLQSTYDNTLETYPIRIENLPTSSSSYYLQIQPKTGVNGLSITSSSSTGTVLFDNADYIYFNGSPGGGSSLDTTNNLLINNTGGGYTFRFVNDATNNQIKYCKIKGANTSTSSGTISFGAATATTGTGNDYNTISYNKIFSGTTTSANAIYASGATSDNDYVTIDNNFISDYFAAGSASNGIFLSTNNSLWAITNNRFYQTTSRTKTAANQHSDININNSSGVGFSITSNVIGYATQAGTGKYTLTGNSANGSVYFPICVNVGTSTVSNIYSNTITALTLTDLEATVTSGTAPGCFSAIAVNGTGNVNIGASTQGNTIGTHSDNTSITFVNNSVGGLEHYGIFVKASTAAGNTVNVNYNNIGGISQASTATNAQLFYPIYIVSTNSGGTISYNTIGSTTTSNSIAMGVSGQATTSKLWCIANTANSSITQITNNTIQNCTIYGTGSTAEFYGISNSSTSVTNIDNNNVYSINISNGIFKGGIYNNASATMSISSNNIGKTTPSNDITIGSTDVSHNIGIYVSGSSQTYTISSNVIQNINTTGAAAKIITGIYLNSTGTFNLTSNTVSTLNNSNTGAFTGKIYGVFFVTASSVSTLRKNKFISFSTSQTSTPEIYGIWHNDALGTCGLYNNLFKCSSSNATIYGIAATGNLTYTLYYNTIDIGGTGTGSTVSAPFKYVGVNASTLVAIKNNIFNNSRTGGTANYSFYVNDVASTSAGSIDYNFYSSADATNYAWVTAAKNSGAFSTGAAGYGGTNSVYSTATLTIATTGALGTNEYLKVAKGMNASSVNSFCQEDITGSTTNRTSGAGIKGCYEYSCGSSVTGPLTWAIGSGGDYATLTEAINKLKICGFTGIITMELNSTYNAAYSAANEMYPIVIDNTIGVDNTKYIKIRPGASVTATISGSNQTLFNLDGADYIQIDGQREGTGATSNLTITNTASAGNNRTILLQNSASNNSIQYCTLKADNNSTSASTAGIVFIGDGTTGNNSNAFSNNTITFATTSTTSGIVSVNSTGTSSSLNVSNNNFQNILNWGVYIGTGANTSTVSNNDFYATTSLTPTASVYPIYISNSGSGYTISGNDIGGQAINCGANNAPYTLASSANAFAGIYLSSGTTATNAIDGNTIKNITFNTSLGTTTGAGIFAGIYVAATGTINIGTTTANNIGNLTGAGASTNTVSGILIVSSTSLGKIVGIEVATTSGTTTIQKNNIGCIGTSNSSTMGYTIYGIRTSGSAAITIGGFGLGNTIGGSVANSILVGGASTTAVCSFYGIENTSSGVITNNYNTIQNINVYGSGTSASLLYGINNTGGADNSTISSNIIKTLSLALTGTAGSFYGINQTAVINITISNNTISNLTLNNSATTRCISFSYSSSLSKTATVSNNTIGSSSETIVVTTTSATGGNFCGIYIRSNANTFNLNDNYIGYFRGTTTTNYYNIEGIYTTDNTGAPAINLTGNTVEYLQNRSTATAANPYNSVRGINISSTSSTSSTIRKNIVRFLSTECASNNTMSGITLSSTNNSLVNNLVIMNNSDGTNTYTVKVSTTGVSLPASSTNYVYYNTFSVGGSDAGTNNTCRTFTIGQSSTATIYNNIFQFSRAGTFGGSYCLDLSQGTNNGTYTLDYNYYVNSNSTQECSAGNTTFARFKSTCYTAAGFNSASLGGTNSIYSTTTLSIGSDGSVATGTVGRGADLRNTSTYPNCQDDIYAVVGERAGNSGTANAGKGVKGCYEGSPTIFYSRFSTSNTSTISTSNWSSNRNGSGIQPADFITAGQTFIVQNNHQYQVGASWVGSSTSIIQVESGGALDLNGANAAGMGTTSNWQRIDVAGIGVSSSGALFNASSTAASLAIPITLTAASTFKSTGSGGLTLTGNIVNGGFTATVDGANATAISTGVVSGAGGITKTGSGTLTLSGTNTYTGVTTINAGTLSVASIGNGGVAGNLGQATNSVSNIVLGGGTLQYTGSTASTDRAFTLTASTTSTIDVNSGSTTLTMSGNSGGSTNGALTKSGSGNLTLSGTNTYTGSTTISSGKLILGAANTINNASNLIINGGTLSTGASTGFNETMNTLKVTASGSIELGTGDHTLTFANSSAESWTANQTLTIYNWQGTGGSSGTAGKINCSSITGLSAGQLSKVAFNGYTCGTSILQNAPNTGEVVPSTAPTLSSTLTPSAICSGATFTYSPTSATGGATFTWTRAAVTDISNAAITAAQSFNPSETLTNTSSSSVNVVYAYTISVNSCSNTQNVTVAVNPIPSITTATSASVCSGGDPNITLSSSTASSYAWTLGTNTGSITGSSASSGATISQTLMNPSNSASGSVEYVVTPTSTTGSCVGSPTTITVTVNPIATSAVLAGTTSICSGSANLTVTITGGTSPYTVVYTGNGGGTVNNYTSASNISQSPASTTTYGLTSVTDANGCTATTPSGTPTITVYAQPSITTHPLDATITEGGTYSPSIVATGGVSLTYQWQYSTTSGGVYSNVVDNTPTNATYTSATTNNMSLTGNVTAGTYFYKCYVTSTGSGCNAVSSNVSILTINSSATTFYTVTSTANTSAEVLSNWNSMANGTGSAPLDFTTAGQTFIVQSGHQYQVKNTWTGSATSNIQISAGGALDLNNQTLASWQGITLAGSGVSNSGALFNSSSSASSCSIPLTLSAAATIVSSGTGGLTLTGNVNNGGYALTIDGVNPTSITTGVISGSGGLNKNGSGKLTLTGANTFTGATNINAGVVNIQNATALGTTAGTVTVASGAALELQGEITVGAKALTLNNDGISSAGALRNISGANTWGGAITLSTNAARINSDAGTLTLSGAISNGSINLTIGGAGNVVANGIIGNGAGNLTKDGAGTLTLGATNTYTGTTTLTAGNLTLGAAQTALTNDIILTAGTLNATDYAITTSGNWTNNGATFIYGNNNTVSLTGASKTIGGTTSTTFNNLALNGGSTYSLGIAQTVSNTLSFNGGSKLTLSSFNLTVNNGISYSDASNFIVTNGIGKLIQGNFTANQYKLYPIGFSSNSYTPCWVKPSSVTGTDNYGLRVKDNDAFNGLSCTPKSAKCVNRTWFLTDNVSGTVNANIKFQWNSIDEVLPFDRSNIVISRCDGGAWSQLTNVNHNSSSLQADVDFSASAVLTRSPNRGSEFGFNLESPNALPIELLYFTAKQSGTKVKLDWATASEQNNDYFVVERSQDGTNFTEVFRKKGAGNSVNTLYYNGFDNAPLEGISYYRLKQVDFDAKFKYSDIQSVNFKFDPAEVGVKIYPNPAIDNKFTVDYTKEKADQLEVYFYNSIGQLLHKEAWSTNKGINTKEFYFPDVSEGMYILELKASDGTSVKQHIKM